MSQYDRLDAFPDVISVFPVMRISRHLVEAYVFTNGTDDMVEKSVKMSPALGAHASLFNKLITVDSLKVYKPAQRVYDHLLSEVGKVGRESEVWVVSGNPFDVVGAKVAGLKTAWIDRDGTGWVDRLDERAVPDITAPGVYQAVQRILKESTEQKD
jgi:2-haloacid dehalogenase